MNDSRLAELKESERECLRAYTTVGEIGAVADLLGIKLETARARLRAARRTLRVNTTKQAAALLAQAEGRIPVWGASLRAIPAPPYFDEPTTAAGGVAPIVRDAADWAPLAPAAPPDDERRWPRRLGHVLKDGATQAILIAILLVIVGYLIAIVIPRVAAPNTFEPEIAPSGERSPTVMEKQTTPALRLHSRLRAAERAHDRSMRTKSELLTTMLEAHAETGVPYAVGQSEIEETYRALGHDVAARRAMGSAHAGLVPIAKAVGYDYRMAGDIGSTQEAFTELLSADGAPTAPDVVAPPVLG